MDRIAKGIFAARSYKHSHAKSIKRWLGHADLKKRCGQWACVSFFVGLGGEMVTTPLNLPAFGEAGTCEGRLSF